MENEKWENEKWEEHRACPFVSTSVFKGASVDAQSSLENDNPKITQNGIDAFTGVYTGHECNGLSFLGP